MSDEPTGLSIEISGLASVALFMAAILPGYAWIRKGSSQKEILTRSAVVGTGLLGLALATGFKERS